ncbi:MAG: hypothetical protein ACRDMA_08755 [Solirubrobacterales bacterium]
MARRIGAVPASLRAQTVRLESGSPSVVIVIPFFGQRRMTSCEVEVAAAAPDFTRAADR